MAAYTRPPLKWAGGKFALLSTILPALPKGARLVEPFGGAGSVFLNAVFHRYLVAEVNLDLIQLYQHLQQEGASFMHDCAALFTPDTNTANFYYHAREAFNASTSPRERAVLFLYLNRHGYNGLCRYNQQGIYNVPFGQHPRPYFPHKELLFFIQKSQQAMFIHQDFRQTFASLQPNDVVYCDPPYVPLSETQAFTAYTHRAFSDADQQALAQLAREAAQAGHTVLISNHDTPVTRHYYQGSTLQSFKVQRYISQNGNTRKPVKELLATFSRERELGAHPQIPE